ncbi:cytochrome b/b6 domain-containing protein [Rhodopila sp.]|uniref:cytochrome b/b6 domain-containing protein n=1 Tax=Rhodopila sp. TaxID=2480087 RepID=UPI003D12E2AE
MTQPPRSPGQQVQTHPIAARITHWLMALAILVMIGSGWRIYNSSPIFGFSFPVSLTLGGNVEDALALHNDPGVASAIAWHFAGMWLLLLSYLGFMLWNTITGHFWRDFLPVGPVSFWRDFTAAARLKLDHRLGEYNAVQRVAYWGVLAAVAMMLLSGIAIWKPVQTYPLETLFGGFQGARIVHFVFMTAIALFIVIHVALVILVPKTFVAMTLGRATAHPHTASPHTASPQKEVA